MTATVAPGQKPLKAFAEHGRLQIMRGPEYQQIVEQRTATLGSQL